MIQDNDHRGNFDGLVTEYDRYRIGYSSELFDFLESVGFRRGAHVLDVGCGTGLATQALVDRGISVVGLDRSVEMIAAAKQRVASATFTDGTAEHLPYDGASFDGAISAQAFHWFDGDAAFAELLRVVKPGGPIAVWWKILGSDDALRELRAEACARIGLTPSLDPLRGGFNAFYRAPFSTRTLRVLPFIARLSVDDWLGYETSRVAARDAYGAGRDAYLGALRDVLVARFGSGAARIEVRYTQYLYVGTAP